MFNQSTQQAQSDLVGKSLRLAFHDAAEVDITDLSDKMGSDGCLSTSSDNIGLLEDNSIVMTVFEPLWQSVCDKISRADFWVLLAIIFVHEASGQKVSIPFYYGRKDAESSCSDGTGRLPNAFRGASEFQRVFINQMGLTMKDATTLIGAHTVGHMHLSNSGFGVSTSDPKNVLLNAWDGTPNKFDNGYFFDLFNRVRSEVSNEE